MKMSSAIVDKSVKSVHYLQIAYESHINIYHACTFSFSVCLDILQIGTRHFKK